MRAREFVSEQKNVVPDQQRFATRGLHTFTDTNYDRLYTLNRVMMAVASTDGNIVPELEDQSWAAKQNTSHPYTEEEQKMLLMAYKAANVKTVKDLNKGDLRSQELKDTNKESILKPFKGYKKK